MSNIQINKFDSREELFSAVANACRSQLEKVLKEKNKASFIIPGGTTPAPSFAQLAIADIDWKNITIGQSDERWVDADHEQSNQGLTQKTLLIDNAKSAKYVAMKNSAPDPFAGESQCNSDYAAIAPFSVTMLGMGLDGHIASLFPNSKTIDQALSLNNENTCIAIDAEGCKVAGDFPHRMSLTLSAIVKSELIILLVTGSEKLSVIEKAMITNDPKVLPVSGILNQQKTAVKIFWAE